MSCSVTAWKYWYQEHQPTWYGVRVRALAAAPAQSAHRSSSTVGSPVATRIGCSARVACDAELRAPEVRLGVDLDEAGAHGAHSKRPVMVRAAFEAEQQRTVVVARAR